MAPSDPIEVRSHGKGPGPVVVLHGGPGAPGSAAPLARALSDEFHVLEPWQRSRDEHPLSVARHVQDLAEVAPRASVLVGWSWGAMLALSYACNHPDRVRGIVLVGCGTYDPVSRAEYQARLQDTLGVADRACTRKVRHALDVATDDAERDALWGELGALLDRAQSVDLLPREPHTGAFDGRGAAETWDDALRLQADGVEPQRFASITCPVLMLHGNQDPHPGEATRDQLLHAIPHLAYVGFERCGHEPWSERHGREPFFAALRSQLRAWLSD